MFCISHVIFFKFLILLLFPSSCLSQCLSLRQHLIIIQPNFICMTICKLICYKCHFFQVVVTIITCFRSLICNLVFFYFSKSRRKNTHLLRIHLRYDCWTNLLDLEAALIFLWNKKKIHIFSQKRNINQKFSNQSEKIIL